MIPQELSFSNVYYMHAKSRSVVASAKSIEFHR